MDVRAKLIEIYKRVIKVKPNDKEYIYLNGLDNKYPYEIEGVIENSPTAKKSVEIRSRFLAGKVVNDRIINAFKQQNLSDVVNEGADVLTSQGGVFYHVGWGLNELGDLVQKTIEVLNYPDCRISKEDDYENKGKIYVANWVDKNCDKDKVWYYPYNPNKSIVLEQIWADYKKEGGTSEDLIDAIKTYRGQVFYWNTTPRYHYALSPLDAVYNDCDTEYRISLYGNTQWRSGFLGKTIVLTQGLDKEANEDIEDNIADWLGSENSGAISFNSLSSTDDIDKVMKVIQLKPQYDDKLFVEISNRCYNNIIGQLDIPKELIEASGSVFDGGASKYRELKLYMCESVRPNQVKMMSVLKYLGFETIIEPLETREEIDENTTENETN